MKLLLETGKVEMDSKDSKHGRTPLSWAAGSWAAQNGCEAVVVGCVDRVRGCPTPL